MRKVLLTCVALGLGFMAWNSEASSSEASSVKTQKENAIKNISKENATNFLPAFNVKVYKENEKEGNLVSSFVIHPKPKAKTKDEATASTEVSITKTTTYVESCEKEKDKTVLTPGKYTEKATWNLVEFNNQFSLEGQMTVLRNLDTVENNNCFVQLPQKDVFFLSHLFPQDVSEPLSFDKNGFRVIITPLGEELPFERFSAPNK